MGITVSVDEAELRSVIDGVPSLVRVMSSDRPLDPSVRIPLEDVSRVTLGRGEAAVIREGGEVTVRIPDDRMSSVHAQLVRAGRRFVLEDASSKNGTLLNGRRCAAAAQLDDGDVIETGHTFFVYRARVPIALPAGTARMITEPADDVPLTTFVPGLARQLERLAKIAHANIPVVVLGETGTGKEVVARSLHRLSKRSGPFIALNCGAIPATLVEAELFGARKGAFTGATDDRAGLIRAAEGGTLFLDEVGELPLPAQVSLLRVLQEHEVMPIGGTKPIKVDVRVVAATHQALDRMVDAATFRADLYARLGGLTVRLPPLRERREDLGLVIASLLRRISPIPHKVRISLAAARVLFLHDFPHNIRELEKALALALAMAEHGRDGGIEIDLDGFPDELQSVRPHVTSAGGAKPDVAEPRDDEARKAELVALLVRHRGRVADVARAMGKARMQIHRWIQKYDIDLESYRKL